MICKICHREIAGQEVAIELSNGLGYAHERCVETDEGFTETLHLFCLQEEAQEENARRDFAIVRYSEDDVRTLTEKAESVFEIIGLVGGALKAQILTDVKETVRTWDRDFWESERKKVTE